MKGANMKYSKLLITALTIFTLSSCSMLKGRDTIKDVNVAERDVSPISISSETEIENFRQALNRLNETLNDIQATKKKRKVAVFTDPLKINKGTTLKDALSRYKVDYSPEQLGFQTFKDAVTFDNNVEFFDYIEERFGLFVDETSTGLLISELKEKKYRVSFLEKMLQEELQQMLHHKDASANLQANIGILTVIDDPIGHAKIEEYIKQVKGLIINAYSYDIRIDEKGKALAASSGEVTPVTPAMFGGSGTLNIIVKGGRILTQFRHVHFPNSVAFFLPSDGGTYTAREGDVRLRVTLRREPLEWIEAQGGK